MKRLSSRIPALILVGVALWLLVPASATAQTPYLVDTGPGGTSTIGSASLFASGSTACSPQPACASNLQYLAGQFTLGQAATISSIELWLPAFGTGGDLNVKIRSDNNGLPGVAAPFRLRPNHIFSKTYTVPNRPGVAGWYEFTSYDTVLAAGTYWVTFEPVGPSNFNMTPPRGAPNPLTKYAFLSPPNVGYAALGAAQSSIGIRIAGTTFPGLGFGSGSRTMLDGSVFGCCHVGPYDFQNGGEGQALTVSYIFVIPAGFSHGRGKLFPNGVSAGAYAANSGPCVPSGGSCAHSAGRGIAYRTFVNLTDAAITFRVNAVLDGSFGAVGGNAAAGIYALDSTGFTNTILGSGVDSAEYLLRRDDLAALASGGAALSLASLFPGSVLASDFETPTYPANQVGTTPMATGFITLAPDEAFTLLFDVATYAPGGGSVNFSNTLKPAANLFTDLNGQPVHGIVAVGPSSASTPATTGLALAPGLATTPLATPYTVTATATGAGGIPVPDAPVVFTITAGPNAGATATVSTNSNGQASFTYLGGLLGTDSIQASIGALQSNTAQNTWEAGGLDHIVIGPASASVAVGAPQAYTAEAFDALGNSLGDVTASTTFTIAPDGSCTGASCTPAAAGAHTVTGSHSGKTATASLDATGGTTGFTFTGFFAPVDNAPVLNTVKAGSAIPVKFSLNGNQGLNVLAAGFPISQPMACDSTMPSDAIEQTVTAGSSGLQYDAATDQYTYVWKTNKEWASSCRALNVQLSDGTSHMAYFKFSK
jgi:hypothetical protein